MRTAMNRNLPGCRLQGSRHGKPREVIPLSRKRVVTKVIYQGIPEYPVEDIYGEKCSKNMKEKE